MKWLPVLLICSVLACTPESPKKSRFRHDALSTGVVISEVYGGGGSAASAYRYDYVELLNRGTAPVDVSGWSVQYTSDTGGSWQPTPLGSFGMLQPGQSLLVRMGGGTVGPMLPVTHDVSGATQMSATNGKVALVSSTTGLTGTCPNASAYVDLVGYGPMANCSEGGPTAVTSATTSVNRVGNGCQETDSNSNDFTVGGPSPRNSMDTPITCGANPVDAGMNPVDAGTNPADSGCTVIANWPSAATSGGYDLADETSYGELSTMTADGGLEVLTLEAYFGNGLTLPANRTFTNATRYATCEVCAKMSRGCDSMGCAQTFFGQAGSANVTAAAQNAATGEFIGTLSNVRFVEWDFVNDRAVTGGECVVLQAHTVDVVWDAPTGGGGGSVTGGGSGGGSVTGGSGGGSVTGGGSGGGNATGGGSGGGGQMEADAGTGGAGGGGMLGGMSGCGCSTGGEASIIFLLLGATRLLRRLR